GAELPRGGDGARAWKEPQLQTPRRRDRFPRRRRNDADAVTHLLEPLAGREPRLDVVHGFLGHEDRRGRKPGEPAARRMMRETGRVVEVTMREADRRVPQGVLRGAPELEHRAEAGQLVERLVARDRHALDRDTPGFHPRAAPAVRVVGHEGKLSALPDSFLP